MEALEGRYADLLKPLTCGENGAFIEWSSGLISVGRAFDSDGAFKGFLDAPGNSAADRELSATLTHETFHFFQVATMGWAYRWACRLFAAISDGLQESAPASKAETLSGWLLTVEQRFPTPAREQLRQLDAELRNAGPNALSALDLLESQAFLVESRTHYSTLDAAAYFVLLKKQQPGRLYRRAYDVARYRLGDAAAFETFSALASLSLCTRDPAYAFDLLLDLAAGTAGTPDDVFALGEQLPPEVIVGTSVEVREREALTHPTYDPALAEINNVLAEAGFNVMRFFARPHEEQEALMNLTRPIVFGRSRSGRRLIHTPDGLSEDRLWWIVSIAATFVTIMKNDRGNGMPRATPEPDPLKWVELVEPGLLQAAVPNSYLATNDVTCLNVFRADEVAPQFDLLAARWGRTLISFDLEAEYLWTRPEVREFVRGLHAVNPAFPIFLNFEPDYGMAAVWFGSLVDVSAFRGQEKGAFQINHHSVVPFIAATLDAVVSLGQSRGWEMRLPVNQILSAFPRETRHELLMGCGFEPPRPAK